MVHQGGTLRDDGISSYSNRFSDFTPAGWKIESGNLNRVTLPNSVLITFKSAPEWATQTLPDSKTSRLWQNSLVYAPRIYLERGRNWLYEFLRSFNNYHASLERSFESKKEGSTDHQTALQLKTLCELKALLVSQKTDDPVLFEMLNKNANSLIFFAIKHGLLTVSNHGIMLAIFIYHSLRLFNLSDSDSLSAKIEDYFISALDHIVDEDGVVNENSVLYQGLYVSLLVELQKFIVWAGESNRLAKYLSNKYRLVKSAYQQMLLPDASTPPFGDGNRSFQGTYQPILGELYSPESGVYIDKDKESYFLFVCGHRGVIHKQMDDTSIYLNLLGISLIEDGGLLSYDTKDPRATAVRSQRGHSGFFSETLDDVEPGKMISYTNSTRLINGGLLREFSEKKDVHLTGSVNYRELSYSRSINWNIHSRTLHIVDRILSAPLNAPFVSRFLLNPKSEVKQIDARHTLVRVANCWMVICQLGSKSARSNKPFSAVAESPNMSNWMMSDEHVLTEAPVLEWPLRFRPGGVEANEQSFVVTFGSSEDEIKCGECSLDSSSVASLFDLPITNRDKLKVNVLWAPEDAFELDIKRSFSTHPATAWIDPNSLWDERYSKVMLFGDSTFKLQIRDNVADLASSGMVSRARLNVSSQRSGRLKLHFSFDESISAVPRGRFVEFFKGAHKMAELEVRGDVPEYAGAWHRSVSSELCFENYLQSTCVVELVLRTSNYCISGRSTSLLAENNRLGLFATQAIDDVPVHFDDVPGVSKSSNALAFIFSAMSSPGDFTFNYKRAFNKAAFRQVYLLDDFREQGTYYLVEDRSLAIFTAVQKLIHRIVRSSGIDPNNVLFVGSSKGGTAALLHGLAFGSGRVIVGAPQWRIGSFLNSPHPGILSYMAGSVSAESIRWLDSLSTSLASKASFKGRVTVLVGVDDHHYRTHYSALSRDLSRFGVSLDSLIGLGTSHSELGAVFSGFLMQVARMYSGSLDRAYWLTVKGRSVRFSLLPDVEEIYAVQLSKMDGDVVERPRYQKAFVWDWTLPPGRYGIRVYLRHRHEPDPYHAFSVPPFTVS